MGHHGGRAPILTGAAAFDRSRLVDRPEAVAPLLLGCTITVGATSGRIVEVEAYAGIDDPASHAHRGPTPRSAIMFGEVGRLYVYRSYGVHWCANVVAHQEGEPGAVLLRAVEPLAGLDLMRLRRAPAVRRDRDLGSGPGRLTQALGIEGRHDGVDLLAPGSPVTLADRSAADAPIAVASTRIGISRATDMPWRFSIAGSPCRSR